MSENFYNDWKVWNGNPEKCRVCLEPCSTAPNTKSYQLHAQYGYIHTGCLIQMEHSESLQIASGKIFKNFSPKNHVITVKELPSNLASGDVMFMSPSGEIRQNLPKVWYQRFWNWIDFRMRKLLGF